MVENEDPGSSSSSPERRPAHVKERSVPALRRAVLVAMEEAWAALAAAGVEASWAEGVVVACSGGPDSTVLFDALAWLRRTTQKPRMRLVLAHFRHGLHERDDEATAHLERLAAAHDDEVDMPLIAGDWAAEAGTARTLEGEGLEDAARRARYAFLARVAAEQQCALIATGHTLNDQAETVLMRLVAGTGLTGLKGMAPLRAHITSAPDTFSSKSRPSESTAPAPSPWIVRPLLAVRRAEIEAYRTAERLDAVDDPTNTDESRVRNRIRHSVLPQLAEVNPGVVAHLAGLAEDVRLSAAVVAQHAAACVERHYDRGRRELAVGAWLAEGKQTEAAEARLLLLREALKQILVHELGLPPRRVTRRLLTGITTLTDETKAPGAKVALPSGWWVIRVGDPLDRLRFVLGEEHATAAPYVAATLPVTLEGPGEVRFQAAGRRWCLAVAPAAEVQDSEALESRYRDDRPNVVLLAVHAVHWPLTVRGKRDGERFQPLGAPGRRAVREMLREHRVPLDERPSWPVLVGADDVPLWLLGIAISDAARLTDLPASAIRCSYRVESG